MTRAGELRVRLALEAPQRTADGGGGASITWIATTSLWGALRPLSRRERTGAGGRLSQVTHDITIRYRTGVLPDMRFTSGARIFAILAVLDDGSRNRIICHCREETRA